MMVKTSSAMAADDSTRPGMSTAAASGPSRWARLSAHQHDGHGGDRRHGEEDGRPAVVLQQPAADDRPQRDGHARDRAPQPDRAGPFPPAR